MEFEKLNDTVFARSASKRHSLFTKHFCKLQSCLSKIGAVWLSIACGEDTFISSAFFTRKIVAYLRETRVLEIFERYPQTIIPFVERDSMNVVLQGPQRVKVGLDDH